MGARSRGDGGSDKGRVKVRVIEFEMDGNNQTLRDSIRDIVGAIGRGQVVGRPALPAAIVDGTGTTTEEELVVVDSESEPNGDLTDGNGGEPSRRPRPAPRSPVVLDLDLKAGAMPLTDFCTKLNLGSDTDKYSAIAYWMQHVSKLGITEITADHIHTGFRAMKWNTPTDAAAPLRALKRREYGYMKSGSKPGTFILNHVGENHVLDLMKKAGVEL